MGKKKPFIDKKNASTFHLLHRSQRDVGGDGGGVVLWPSPGNNKETNRAVLSNDQSAPTRLSTWRDQLSNAGVVDDYDYDQHMKPITGYGDFIGKSGSRQNGMLDPRAEGIDEGDVREVSRQLESIALTPECMDDDIAQALFGDFEDGEFEEILDDFCVTAAQETVEDEQEEFDFDAHIRDLMQRAAQKEEDAGVSVTEHDWGRHDQEFFSRVTALNNEEEDIHSFDDGEGKASTLGKEEQRILCEKFEQTLMEYDSDDVGELESDEDARGERPIEGDNVLENAMDEFLEEKRDEIFIRGTKDSAEFQQKKGSGFHTLPQPQESTEEAPDKILRKANDFLATPKMDLPPEEILIDGKSYFSQRSRNPWDCESILTTASNLDNNPTTIGSARRRRAKNRNKLNSVDSMKQMVKIELSPKSGIPLSVLERSQAQEDNPEEADVGQNKGEKRNTSESAQEKKLRKQAAKLERQEARMRKKVLKEAFRDAYSKREQALQSDGTAGKSVFRYA